MMRRVTLTLLAAASLSACGLGEKGEVYPIRGSELRAKLASIEPPFGVFGSQAIDWRVIRQGDGSVIWAIQDKDGLELLRFRASTSDEGPTETRVAIEVEPPQGRFHDQVANGMASHQSTVALYRAAMTEQVDAELENREFDLARISGAMGVAVVANMSEIGANFDKMAEDDRRRSRENIDRAYAEERSGGGRGFSSDAEVTPTEEPERGY